MKLMYSTKHLGEKETEKEKLKRAFQEEKLGLPVSVDVQLKQTVHVMENVSSFAPSLLSAEQMDVSLNSESKPIIRQSSKKRRKKKKFDVTFQNNPNSNPSSKFLFYKDDEAEIAKEEKISRKKYSEMQVESLKLSVSKKKKNEKSIFELSESGEEEGEGEKMEVILAASESSESEVEKEEGGEVSSKKIDESLLQNWSGNEENEANQVGEERKVEKENCEENEGEDMNQVPEEEDQSEEEGGEQMVDLDALIEEKIKQMIAEGKGEEVSEDDSSILMEAPVTTYNQGTVVNYTKTVKTFFSIPFFSFVEILILEKSLFR